MQPIERLRYVARSHGLDAAILAHESALALGSLGADVRALVVATRRLIEAHPECGPLWWVAARLLAAHDPTAEGQIVADELATDSTSDELAAALPGGAHIVVSPRPSITDACAQRPDLSIDIAEGAVGDRSSLRTLRSLPESRSIVLDESFKDDDVTIAIVAALAASSDGYLCSEFDAQLIDRAMERNVDVWMVAGVGCVLPVPLFSSCRKRIARKASTIKEDDGIFKDGNFEFDNDAASGTAWRYLHPVGVVDVVVGPNGPFVPTPIALRSTCPVPGELCVE